MTALVAGSIFSTALQQRQVTSNGLEFLAILSGIILQKLDLGRRRAAAAAQGWTDLLVSGDVNGENFEDVEHLPTQQKDRDHDGRDGEDFPEGPSVLMRLEAFRHETQNVQRGEAEDDGPEDVVGVAFLVGRLEDGDSGQKNQGREIAAEDDSQGAIGRKQVDQGKKMQASSPLG